MSKGSLKFALNSILATSLFVAPGVFATAGCSDQAKTDSPATSTAKATAESSSGSTAASADSTKLKEEGRAAGSAEDAPQAMAPPPASASAGDSATATATNAGATPAPSSTVASAAPTVGAGVAAWAHIPANCDAAATADLAKTLASPAFAKDVTPKIDELLATTPKKDKSFERIQALMKDAGLTRESFSTIALCFRDSGKKEPAFMMTIGGDLKPNTLIPAFEKALAAKPKDDATIVEFDGVKAISVKNGTTFGQLSDGTIAVAESADLFKEIMKSGNNAAALGLDVSKEISLVVGPKLIKSQLASGKGKDVFEGLTKLTASIDVSNKQAVVRGATGSAADAKKLDALVTLGKDEVIKKQKEPAIVELLKGVTSRVDGNDVVIEAPIPDKSIELAAQSLGALLAGAKAKL